MYELEHSDILFCVRSLQHPADHFDMLKERDREVDKLLPIQDLHWILIILQSPTKAMSLPQIDT